MHGVGKWHFVQASTANKLKVYHASEAVDNLQNVDMDYTFFIDSVYFHERLLLQNYEWVNASSMRKKSFLRQAVKKTLLYCMIEKENTSYCVTLCFYFIYS